MKSVIEHIKSAKGTLFSFELLTSVIGKFVQINTYDQPGVEAGKIILKNKLQEIN
jgi:glucose-6-phosphate isomerase